MNKRQTAGLPTREEIVAFIKDSPVAVGKREIARAFGLSGAEKIGLKAILKDLEVEGEIERAAGRTFHVGGQLPKVAAIKITKVTADGDIFGEPEVWEHPGRPPTVKIMERGRRANLGVGDRCVARIETRGDGRFRGHMLKRLERKVENVLGVVRKAGREWRLEVADKRLRAEFIIPPDMLNEAENGELVLAEPMGRGRPLGLQPVKVIERLGDPFAPKSFSLIAIHQKGIPTEFSDAALAQAEASSRQPLGAREDLRHIPFLVIDPVDARDHDDAIWAEPDDDPKNKDGWQLGVAIADVSYFVQPGSALDHDARERGNSVYFPDRVVPMLPHSLSSDACSLTSDADKAALVCLMTVSATGQIKSWRFTRALIRCAANLAYEQAQAAIDGHADEHTAPHTKGLWNLWGGWGALKAARDIREPLDLDLPEKRVILDERGRIVEIRVRERFDAHRVIEDYMIAANVAAAKELEGHHASGVTGVYRIHEPPTQEKLVSLKDYLETLEVNLALGQVVRPAVFNRILEVTKEEPFAEQIAEQVLRTQTQAYYGTESVGHFGLSLQSYAHFTSPIRRYADLMVHRGLVRALGLGEGGLTDEQVKHLASTAEHISMTERRAMEAERDTVDRYIAAYLSERIGEVFPGRVTGVAKFGLFVTIEGLGGDGLIPISTLGDERFHFDEASRRLEGGWSGASFFLGQKMPIRLVEANPVTGGMRFELVEMPEGEAGAGPSRARPRSPGGKARRVGGGRVRRRV
ncbi:ribonuclease R [Sphingosinicellaceae bacterium A1X5R2]|nr:ribonuclease R [Pedomonas mirosovicensis]MCH8685629.1 ribonuclease R [Pedomonas mirosovicensis]